MMPMDISEILEKIDIWDAENVFHLKSDPSRLKKIVAHYELFKKIQNVEGDFLEFGVFKGASFLRFATFSEIFENQNRQFFGFDSFEKFPRDDIKLDSDNEFISRLEELINNKQFTTPENIRLIKGNVFETVPAFLKNKQNIKLACIHLDMDVYEPTKYCLDLLFPFLQKNGIIICDDYNQVDGATKAFDEFSEKHEKNIRKLEFSKPPYFIENN